MNAHGTDEGLAEYILRDKCVLPMSLLSNSHRYEIERCLTICTFHRAMLFSPEMML